jgi:hypothetical protein
MQPIAAALLLAAPPVVVVGNGPCPAPADVAARLDALLPAGAAAAANVASIEDRGSQVRIALAAPDGSPVGERTLERAGSCADLAAAAAVVIASWQAAAHPEFVPAAPPPVVPPAAVHATAPEVRAGGGLRWTVDAGLALALDGEGSAGAAVLALSLAPARWRLGLRTTAALMQAQERALGVGRARWSRWPLLAGPELRLASGAVRVSAHAQAALSLLRVEGRGYDQNLAHSSVAFGLAPGARLGFGRGRWQPWLGVDLLLWPRTEKAFVGAGDPAFTLPSWQVLATGGVGFGS